MSMFYAITAYIHIWPIRVFGQCFNSAVFNLNLAWKDGSTFNFNRAI